MIHTLYRHIDEPRFLTNLSHENIYAVNIFMRLNEFSSVRLAITPRLFKENAPAFSFVGVSTRLTG